MTPSTKAACRRLRQLACWLWSLESPGQAMVEYSTISTVMLLGGIAVAGGWGYYDDLMRGFDTYLGSVYFVLKMAFP